MSVYASLFRKVIFPVYDRMLRRRGTAQALREYQANLGMSTEELRTLQLRKLKALLHHAHDQVPYYRQTWEALGIHPQDVHSLGDFAQFPVITKEIIQQHYSELRASGTQPTNIAKATGGSSGEPLRFEITRQSNELREAVMWRGYAWAGLQLGMKTAYLWGVNVGPSSLRQRLKDSGYHRFYNRKIFDSFGMNEENLASYVTALNTYKADAMVCYVSPLVTLANYILQSGNSVRSPKVILTGAEPLHEFQRSVIEQAFGCAVINTYGCREFMLVAAECGRKQGLHTNIDHLVVETLDEQGDSVFGVEGQVAITDLSNYGMPFIRYINGDMATLTDRVCDCGNPLPLIEKINGRKLDIIHAPNGARLPGEFFPHLLKDFPEVEKFQVRQHQLERIELLVVCRTGIQAATSTAIAKALNTYTQGSLAIELRPVDAIPATPSGKHRVVVNELTGP
ncbi:hypothetical protein Q6D67_01840 [Haliea sp. E1-2-M8]|uniref:phenylacetate--CoA ligase family protein n=1 Tax=Haliea sp. E1-2-M8 TaxID=3064706 RepID=UPI0027253DE3|nr:hypothetical protein [Haliea sp. E1-2-M8]MDO8860426.1 hypothetical protein [Haliea sp. E1-2-M8]